MKLAVVNIGTLVESVKGRTATVIPQAGMLIRDGRIIKTGTQREIEVSITPEVEVVDAGGRMVTPGFVDSHTHIVFGGNRANEFELRSKGATYEDIAASGGGIQASVKATRAASEDELLASAKTRLDWMIANGTTSLECKTGYGLSFEQEIKMLRAIRRLSDESEIDIASTLLACHAVGPEFDGDRKAYVDHIIHDLMPIVANHGLAQWCDMFIEQGYFDAEDAEVVCAAAQEQGFGIRLHVDQLTNSGGAQIAADFGARSADHLEQTEMDGIIALGEAGVKAGLVPASVFALGKTKYPNARAMLDAGVTVVLATDFNPGSSPTPSMPFVLTLACTQMKMTPFEAFAAATWHAAECLDWQTRKGALTADYDADFIVWDAESLLEIPYWIGAPLVRETWIGGKRRFSKAN